MKVQIQSFNGVAPKVNPRYLGEGGAQLASNVEAIGQSLRPLAGLGAALADVTVASNATTVYRFGQDVANESQYWLAWTGDVDVCRGQISGDTEEWTFYTGDGAPKATYNAIRGADAVLTAGEYRPLGLPHPTTPLTATPGGANPDEEPATVVLNPSIIQRVGFEHGLHFSVDGQQSWMSLDLTRYNLLPETEDFTQKSSSFPLNWTNDLYGGVTVTHAAETAPDGSETAVKMQRINVNWNATTIRLPTMEVGEPYTYSVYLKGLDSARSEFSVQRVDTSPFRTAGYARVDWAAGVATVGGSTGTHKLTAVGSGWYRLAVTFTLDDTMVGGEAPLRLVIMPAGGTHAGTEGIYVWGPQLERGSVATPYVRTVGGVGKTITPWVIVNAFRAYDLFVSATPAGSNTVIVKTNNTGDAVRLAIRYGSGETTLISGTGATSGTSGTAPECYIPYTHEGAPLVQLWVSTAADSNPASYTNAPKTTTWAAGVNAVAVADITAADAGSFLKLTRTATGKNSRINVKAWYYKPSQTLMDTPNQWGGPTYVPAIDVTNYFLVEGTNVGTADPTAAVCTITSTLIGKLPKNSRAYFRLSIEAGYSEVYLNDTSPSAIAAAFDAKTGLTATVSAAAVTVSTTATGADAFLEIKWPIGNDAVVSAEGKTLELGTKETRLYVYTWVNTEGGLTMESAPSDTSNEVEVYANQSVQLSGFPSAVLSGFGSDHLTVRIYRTTADTYLFVAELAFVSAAAWSAAGEYVVGNVVTWVFAAGTFAEETRYYRCIQATGAVGDAAGVTDSAYWVRITGVVDATTGWTDATRAANLGEECPSLLWAAPPATLAGLTNLPNGMMAGFTGRDVYFCEPYRPYAWPESYILSLDTPVVGLAAIDTTLCALTKDAPYFIQGTAPGLMTQVRSDVSQACVAKRSIVSIGRAVFYAAPDGLVMLSPGGSKIATEARFSRAQWQALNPSSIHGYGHDGRYYGFFTGADHANNPWIPAAAGGFVYDIQTGEFYLHATTSRTAFADPRNDTLYLADGTSLKRWEGGTTKATGRWRSKVFSMPRETFFSCIQLEAEGYGTAGDVQLQVRCDGVDVFTPARNITSRRPIRLPTVVGRDWEIDITTKHEIYNVIMAQSMAELADG